MYYNQQSQYSNPIMQPTYLQGYQQSFQQYQQPYSQMQNNQIMQQNNEIIKGRAVTSIDEAKSIPYEMDGSIKVFTDFTHGKIYTNQMNLTDGSLIFKEYSLIQPQNSNPQQSVEVEYVSKSDYDKVVSKLKEFENKLHNIEKGLGMNDE